MHLSFIPHPLLRQRIEAVLHLQNRWNSVSFKEFIAERFGPDAYGHINDHVVDKKKSFSTEQHHYVVGYNAHPSSYPPPPPPYSYGNPFNNPPSYPPQSPYPQPYGYRACLPSNVIIPNDRTTLLEQPYSGDHLLPKIGLPPTTRIAQPFSTEEVRTFEDPIAYYICF